MIDDINIIQTKRLKCYHNNTYLIPLPEDGTNCNIFHINIAVSPFTNYMLFVFFGKIINLEKKILYFVDNSQFISENTPTTKHKKTDKLNFQYELITEPETHPPVE